ncbi:hypothetical protein [Microbacterium sp. RURRCA19A]|uniref:hypothetical protein n=1 Tax=Microbacterium sp. RURRCA19A TaxID=1907391 RepID=UPI000957129B|nr:hypothetical protein [Microbacterium sp. RURRCA19A]SIS19663.1 hypothetical protein SAMN05880568_3469 [Microbacterium sp. RURRCA19A]
MTTKKAPAGQGEGEDQNQSGTIMHDFTQDPDFRRGHAGVKAWAHEYADSLAAIQARVRAHADWAAAAADASKIGLSEQQVVDEVVKKWGWRPPAYPRELWPSWAVECEVSEMVAWDALVSFRAPSHGEREALTGVSVECIYTVVVSEQPGLAVGDYFEGQPYIWSSALGDALDLDVAIAMRGNLEAATAELVRIAERDARTVMP